MTKMSGNRLSSEVSPYLLQHAANPVDWYPWSAAAFAEARRHGKPILLSVGYSACHWCHVMAHESFEDESTAEVMNALFVNIKVDREERPDVDQLYMSALSALGEQGGWPLTMFLDSDGRPFWGGTYFPKTARYGRPAFKDVLKAVRATFDNRRMDMQQNATAILRAITPATPGRAEVLSQAALNDLASRIADMHDDENGGLSGAPKFPNPPILEFLWRAANRTGDESNRSAVLTTLERMCRGGISDHLGGGFARYSVDEQWLVPHFEKMLYDNAQLLPLLALAAKRTGGPIFHHAAESIVGWLTRDMMTETGAFAASEDADSLTPEGHAEEGAFYTFTPAEIEDALGPEARAFIEAYEITPAGNFEGRSIPNLLAARGLDDPAIDRFANHRKQLLAAREARPRPHRDDKILADWNGLMIAGLARAAMLLEHPSWMELAARAFAAIADKLGSEDGLAHAWRDGKSVRPGFASDHAAMALAALAMYEATSAEAYLTQAATWADHLQRHYRTPQGTFAMTRDGADDLPFRPAPTHDDAVPNANAMAAEAFIRLFGITGDMQWLTAADDLLEACAAAMKTNPFGHAGLMNALDLRMNRVDITISGPLDDPIRKTAETVPYTNRTLKHGGGSNAFATVCVDGRCSLPIAYPEQLRERIDHELQHNPSGNREGPAA